MVSTYFLCQKTLTKTLLPRKQPSICQGICMRTSVTLRLILVFLSAPSIATPLPVKAEAKTIFVPDDFPTIQEAIDNASEGDTVFVRKGTYDVWEYDAMNIDKSISLIGESSQDTIINRLPRGYSEAVIRVEADRVTISGFTLNGSNIGIYLWNTASNCKIVANKIAHNDIGVYVGASNSNIISGNNIIDSKNEGIFAHYSSDIVISENHIKNIHNTGIKVSYCQNITIKRNEIVGNANGLSFGTDTDHLYVYENNIIDNSGFGVQFDYANATVYNNNIMRNGIGINLQNFEFSSNSAMG
jgi:nitrous oxidase accessory protein